MNGSMDVAVVVWIECINCELKVIRTGNNQKRCSECRKKEEARYRPQAGRRYPVKLGPKDYGVGNCINCNVEIELKSATHKFCGHCRGTRKKEQHRIASRAWTKNNTEQRKEMDRIRQIKRYGITLEEYNALLEYQGGGCAVCGKIYDEKPLAIDHNHETGEVRGLLCNPRCNLNLIGNNDKHPELLLRGYEYLMDPPFKKLMGTKGR